MGGTPASPTAPQVTDEAPTDGGSQRPAHGATQGGDGGRWPEAYAYAERGDLTAVYRVTSLVICATSGAIAAPPGIAFSVLGMSCRLKP